MPTPIKTATTTPKMAPPDKSRDSPLSTSSDGAAEGLVSVGKNEGNGDGFGDSVGSLVVGVRVGNRDGAGDGAGEAVGTNSCDDKTTAGPKHKMRHCRYLHNDDDEDDAIDDDFVMFFRKSRAPTSR